MTFLLFICKTFTIKSTDLLNCFLWSIIAKGPSINDVTIVEGRGSLLKRDVVGGRERHKRDVTQFRLLSVILGQ